MSLCVCVSELRWSDVIEHSFDLSEGAVLLHNVFVRSRVHHTTPDVLLCNQAILCCCPLLWSFQVVHEGV